MLGTRRRLLLDPYPRDRAACRRSLSCSELRGERRRGAVALTRAPVPQAIPSLGSLSGENRGVRTGKTGRNPLRGMVEGGGAASRMDQARLGGGEVPRARRRLGLGWPLWRARSGVVRPGGWDGNVACLWEGTAESPR